jgi:S1-C subfamily serine protease
MRLRNILVLLVICPAVYCQDLPHPLTQVEACQKSKRALVQVDTDTMHGTGFIVDSDGWIVTALHVVADPNTLNLYDHISVSIPGYPHPIPAEIVSRLDKFASPRDFVVLKIDKTKLFALDLGTEVNVEDGSPIAIVGLPLSAIFRIPIKPVPPFCFAGTIAVQTSFGLGNLEFLHTIYFQGVSIKGISGAPIVSLVTGKVIGIVSTRLTGITQGLDEARTGLNALPKNIVMAVNGVDSVRTTIGLIDTLDQQLANGLGAGSGASDASMILNRAKRDYDRRHPKK